MFAVLKPEHHRKEKVMNFSKERKDQLMKKLGVNMRAIRKALGLNLKQMSVLLNKHENTVLNLEHGKHSIKAIDLFLFEIDYKVNVFGFILRNEMLFFEGKDESMGFINERLYQEGML